MATVIVYLGGLYALRKGKYYLRKGQPKQTVPAICVVFCEQQFDLMHFLLATIVKRV